MNERTTCCYIFHVEIDQLRLGLNNIRVTFELDGKCSCTCPYVCPRNANHFSCNVGSSIYLGITMMWLILICPKKDEDEWHHNKCLYGQCKDCGIKNILVHPVECNGSNPIVVEWKRFAMETPMSKVEHPLKKLTFVYKKTKNEKSMSILNPSYKILSNIILYRGGKISNYKLLLFPSPKT